MSVAGKQAKTAAHPSGYPPFLLRLRRTLSSGGGRLLQLTDSVTERRIPCFFKNNCDWTVTWGTDLEALWVIQ